MRRYFSIVFVFPLSTPPSGESGSPTSDGSGSGTESEDDD
jgi:hypothetical protein